VAQRSTRRPGQRPWLRGVSVALDFASRKDAEVACVCEGPWYELCTTCLFQGNILFCGLLRMVVRALASTPPHGSLSCSPLTGSRKTGERTLQTAGTRETVGRILGQASHYDSLQVLGYIRAMGR